MTILPKRLVLACLVAGPLTSQTVVTVEESRMASRLMFVGGFKRTAEVSVQYGAAKWREEFAKEQTGKTLAHYRLGSGFWASLHNNVELQFGAKKAPSSIWYLGLVRDADNQWHLSMMDSSKLHRTGLTSGSTRDVRPDLLVPLKVTKVKAAAETLSARVESAGIKDKPGAAKLVLRWGPFQAVADFHAAAEVGNPAGEPAFAPFDKTRVVKTASGLRYQELRPGAGKQPTIDDKVTVHYVGWTTDGKKFDSSFSRKQATAFPLKGVIKGWQEGIAKMKPGAIFRLEIPPELAYGERGAGGVIQPNSTLVFWVELVKAQ